MTVKEFKYLGSTATYNNKLDTELRLRKSKASQAFGRLIDRVWFNKDLTIKTKCAVYSAIVLSTLLYGQNLGQCTWPKPTVWMPTWWGTWGKSWVSNGGIISPTKTSWWKLTCPACTKHSYIATSDGQVTSSGSTTLGCQSKSFTPSSRKDIEALAGQNSVSKIPSKETWHGKGFRQGAGSKKLTTDHSGEN